VDSRLWAHTIIRRFRQSFLLCVRSVTVAQNFTVRKFAALGVDQKFLFAADDGAALSDAANAGDQVRQLCVCVCVCVYIYTYVYVSYYSALEPL
jgi:hypothetical protein